MIDFINKSVWVLLNPMSIGLLLLVLGIVLRRSRRLGFACLVGAVLWLYLMSTRLALSFIGAPLERAFLVDGRMPDAESYPTADAILDFGGGVGANTNVSKYAELFQAADRAYFSAALWKAGKAPVIIPSSRNVADCDAKFLMDLGVPESAIVIENEALNTEENAKRIVRLFDCSDCASRRIAHGSSVRGSHVSQKAGNESQAEGHGTIEQSNNPNNRRIRVLLVTSAWHMKRSLLMMRKYASKLEVIPAPCDFEATQATSEGFAWSWLKPEPVAFLFNSVCLHEWLGYWGYRLLR